MLIANSFEEIYENLDFTDSIIESINWENNLLDLVLTIDYYHSEGEEELLKLRFKDCLKADFSLTANLLSVSEEDQHAYSMSWYTIQHYRQVKDSELLMKYNHQGLMHLEIFTVDHVMPWLSVISKGIEVERIKLV